MSQGTRLVCPGLLICLRISLSQVPGPPTQEKAYKALLASEIQAHATSRHGVIGAVHFINNGLRLEHDQ